MTCLFFSFSIISLMAGSNSASGSLPVHRSAQSAAIAVDVRNCLEQLLTLAAVRRERRVRYRWLWVCWWCACGPLKSWDKKDLWPSLTCQWKTGERWKIYTTWKSLVVLGIRHAWNPDPGAGPPDYNQPIHIHVSMFHTCHARSLTALNEQRGPNNGGVHSYTKPLGTFATVATSSTWRIMTEVQSANIGASTKLTR